MNTVTRPATLVNWTSQPPAQPKAIVMRTDFSLYMVAVESADGLRIVSDLMSKADARDLADEVAKQLLLQRLAAESATTNRVAKAMAIAGSGMVSRNSSTSWIVQSQTSEDVAYYVSERGGCDCPDAVYNKPSGGCKHQLAVRMHERMQATHDAGVNGQLTGDADRGFSLYYCGASRDACQNDAQRSAWDSARHGNQHLAHRR